MVCVCDIYTLLLYVDTYIKNSQSFRFYDDGGGGDSPPLTYHVNRLWENFLRRAYMSRMLNRKHVLPLAVIQSRSPWS